MKKIILFIVLLSYLAVSSGIVINFHYCMNRLASTEWFAAKSERCGKCGMNIPKSLGCCHDEVKVVKMKDDQKVTPVISFELPSIDLTAHVPSAFIATSFYNGKEKAISDNHPPPLLPGQDTYITNCVFRI